MKNQFILIFTALLLAFCDSFSQTAPSPLYRDPVTDGAADPTLIYNRGSKCWTMLYTQRRANAEGMDVAYCYGSGIGVAESFDHGMTWVYKGKLALDFEDGTNTFWAPEVVYDNGNYHMYVTYIKGVRNHFGGNACIVHYTSKDLWKWKKGDALKLSSDAVIDPCLFKKHDGTWKIWYKDEKRGAHTMTAESRDLKKWVVNTDEAIGGPAHEGPNVFEFGGYYWMLTDEWHGIRVHRSSDLTTWERQGLILSGPGTRNEDTPSGAHCAAVTVNDKAYVIYFTHPGRKTHVESPVDENGCIPYKYRRSSIHVAELTVKDGILNCDRSENFKFYLPDL